MSKGSVGKGLGIGVELSLIGVAAAWFLQRIGAGLILLVVGLLQLLWLVPAILYYRGRGERETVKGLLLVGGLVFLLNASWWGLLLSIPGGPWTN